MTKREKELFDLRYEISEAISDRKQIGKKSYLAAALWTACQKTLLEEDAREIIKSLCPDFFEGEKQDDN